ncbi:hypothetical protein H6P81_007615 [Aristolochia fimbriata]|uniref:non-specific serine/threonine protein kinase n=1 Tax=Aristolochia fimbriata TaxID=158543 RepID=A0AAV7F4G0_ARIFI|nr:hypothetical protein H6P81_007615 [Aristolochia fimbriata]
MPISGAKHAHASLLLSSLLFICAIGFVRCAGDEIRILLDFKTALQSTDASLFDSWTEEASGSSSPCNFAGVTCNTAGSVTEIDLASRGVSGTLRVDSLCKLPSLEKVSMAYNLLTGSLGPGLRNCSNLLRAQGGFRPCRSGSGNSGHLRIFLSCFVAGSAIVVTCLACYIYLKKRRMGDDLKRSSRDDSWDLKSFRVLTFTGEEILNGIKDENVIGRGGSGNVYRVVLGNRAELAVKHIWTTNAGPTSGGGAPKSSSPMLGKRRPAAKSSELEAEVATLSSVRHVNVVKLYCSITSEDSSLLVYEYLPNGSLWDRLHSSEKAELDWRRRWEIAMGAAKGLEYLHHGCERPIIHRDVKSSNILLDESFKPRIADFGLAKIVRSDAVNKDATGHVIAGTHGYIAPEYGYTYRVTEKSDVYSFGVVLMELVTGKKPMEPEFGENKDLVWWVSSRMRSRESVVSVVDPRIPESLREDAVKMLRVAVLCTARLPALRPSMRTVVQMLEDAGT